MPATISHRRTALALTLAAACWGLGTVVSKRAVAELPPLTLLSVQLGASLTLLLSLMRLRGLPICDRGTSPLLGRLGVLNPGLAYALGLLGLVYISASLSVMLWAIEPLAILFLAAWFLHERIGPALVALSLVAIGGMLLVIYQPGSTGTALGVALTIGGVACCAAYTVLTRRLLVTGDSTAQVVVAQQAHALVFAFVLVGHDPDFSDLAASLTGSATTTIRKGAFARIDVPRPLQPGAGTLRWLVSPDLLAGQKAR